MHEVPVVAKPTDAFSELLDEDGLAGYGTALSTGVDRLDGRTLWHVNSTGEGGGVAELLRSTLGYLRDGGVDTRWLVIDGDAGFFAITKRIHNRLHGSLGDGGPLGPAEAAHVAEIAAANLPGTLSLIRPGDVAVVHDPQPLGLVHGLATHGVRVIWTCHVGVDVADAVTRSAWDFLRPGLEHADAYTFTRPAYVWRGLDPAKVAFIPPCIDAFSLKNVEIEPVRRDAILARAGLVATNGRHRPTYVRSSGATARIASRADMLEDEPVPAGAPLVVQVSRWDALKDPRGVIEGFVQTPGIEQAHLVMAGPAPSSVADDPEATTVLGDVRAAWEQLRRDDRRRVHLANIPTDDVEENAVIVNALQRRADVVVQKSLAEGFGLTVTEALWKGRPVVASRVGGIQDQIEDGVNGLLVDPRDLTAFGNAVASVLGDAGRAQRLGAAARARVRDRYLAPHYLRGYLELIAGLDV